MAEIRINATGGVKLYDADDSHYAQIIAGTITANTDVMTLGHAAVVMGTKLDLNGNNLILDADADTYLDGGTVDDVVDVYVAGAKDWKFGANSINVLSGTTLTIDSGATITNSGTATGFGGADPSSADGDTLGTASAEWSDLYLADGGQILFGNDQDITLTHVPDTGLILGGTTPTLTIGDAGAEDTKIVFDGNAQDFHIGLDDSTDSLTIGLGSTLGTTSHIVIDEAGHVTMPLQSCFQVQHSVASQDDVSNNTTFNMNNEIFDLNADFNTTTYTFTAPVTGKYLISVKAFVGDLDSAATLMEIRLTTSNRTYRWQYDPRRWTQDPGWGEFPSSVIADFDANDTMYMHWYQTGGTEQANLWDLTTLCGVLVA